MLTYGGDPVTAGMIDLARRRGIPVVFAIHNLAYRKAPPLTDVDARIVASEFARRHYRDHVGLDCHALPNPVDWDRVRVEDHNPRFVTFVNPSPEKGAGVFTRIAHELGRRRPDIPFLVVESRGNQGTLAACGLGRDEPVNVQVMPHTTDPRRFYALTRIALLPSLCPENQPLVAVEAMINGIPVIGSDRGGIPEALGECGFVLPLPERLTPGAPGVPEAFEVAPWVEAIVRLWDDRALYEEHSARARREALRWHPDRVRPLYAGFFRNIGLRDRAASGLVRTGVPDRGFKIQDSGFKIAEGGVRIAEGGVRIQGSGTVRDAGRAGPAFPSGPSAVRSRRRAAAREPMDAVMAPDAPGRGGQVSSLARETEEGAVPLSFAVCISETTILHGNLLASPCLADGSPHELIKILNAPSAADGLNAALRRAKEPWVVVVHQDVCLPPGWDRRVMRQLGEAERRFGPIGIAGVYGVGAVDEPADGPPRVERIGWVVDRGRLLREGPDLPARVATLDELLLILPRGTPLRADPALGFHLYGADLCLQARERGLAVVALGAPCRHNSRSIGLPEAFFGGAEVFARKWAHRLPVATPCVVFDGGGALHLLGNADGRVGSVAHSAGIIHQ